jgi:hypothetical protein
MKDAAFISFSAAVIYCVVTAGVVTTLYVMGHEIPSWVFMTNFAALGVGFLSLTVASFASGVPGFAPIPVLGGVYSAYLMTVVNTHRKQSQR